MNLAGSFGFLPCKNTIEFERGRVSPVSNYTEVAGWVDKYTNADGFLYPPLVRRTTESGGEVPNTERPAHLHRLPASHDLKLLSSCATGDLRRDSAAFIIHLLAYLFGVRLQFHDWWCDGRVPIRSTHNVTFTKNTVEDFLSHSFQTWLKWSEPERQWLTNILFMLSRAPSYEWDWERFMIEYMVLDGCFKLSGACAKKHTERIETLCNKFGIPLDNSLVNNIVALRNDLFHETLWEKSQPCTGVSSEAFLQAYNLRRLNQRLIPVLLGYKTPYVQTNWWTLGSCSFDKP